MSASEGKAVIGYASIYTGGITSKVAAAKPVRLAARPGVRRVSLAIFDLMLATRTTAAKVCRLSPIGASHTLPNCDFVGSKSL
jgi:hypothetical protein